MSAPDRTVTTDLAAMAAGVTQATIRKWVSRGKLTRYGTPGRALYDVNELLALAGSNQFASRSPLRTGTDS